MKPEVMRHLREVVQSAADGLSLRCDAKQLYFCYYRHVSLSNKTPLHRLQPVVPSVCLWGLKAGWEKVQNNLFNKLDIFTNMSLVGFVAVSPALWQRTSWVSPPAHSLDTDSSVLSVHAPVSTLSMHSLHTQTALQLHLLVCYRWTIWETGRENWIFCDQQIIV